MLIKCFYFPPGVRLKHAFPVQNTNMRQFGFAKKLKSVSNWIKKNGKINNKQ